jgi:hypothetical protein
MERGERSIRSSGVSDVESVGSSPQRGQKEISGPVVLVMMNLWVLT